MTTRIILSFLVISLLSIESLKAQNASGYYRKIASEQRKLRTKQVNFYKTSLLYTDKKRVEKGREMVLTQIKNAQKNLNRMPPFKGDSVLRNDYLRVLDIYMEAYTDAYDSAQACKAVMSESEKAMKNYQEAFYYVEDLIADAEERWAANEEYFVNTYTVTPMVDPTLSTLNIYRSLGVYVQDVRATYATLPFDISAIRDRVKAKNFDDLEDARQELAIAAEDAMVNLTSIGNYIWIDPNDDEEREEEDDFLYEAAIDYLEYIKDAADGDMVDRLTDLDNGIYDEDDKVIEKSQEKLLKILDDLIEAETSLNEDIEKFVFDYVDQ